jgi:proteic killer suppression protein
MRVRFANKRLALVETDKAHEAGLPVAVIIAARKKLQFLRSAKDERDLRNWKSLHFEKMEGDRMGERSIRINKQYRIVFRLDDTCNPQEVTVIEIGDTH